MVTTPIAIVTPIWRPELDAEETAFTRVTDRTNRSVPRVFIAPLDMDTEWYSRVFPEWEIRRVDSRHLASVGAYSAWMAGPDLYRMFLDVDSIVVCQTDAVLVRSVEDLNTDPFDFVGAPWTPPVRVLRMRDRLTVFSPTGGGPLAARILGRRLWVGNGGLSTRKTAQFVEVASMLKERFPERLRQHVHEDVYFAALGPSAGLRIADRVFAGSIFCESAAQHLTSLGELWGFHGLSKWNPTLAQSISDRPASA